MPTITCIKGEAGKRLLDNLKDAKLNPNLKEECNKTIKKLYQGEIRMDKERIDAFASLIRIDEERLKKTVMRKIDITQATEDIEKNIKETKRLYDELVVKANVLYEEIDALTERANVLEAGVKLYKEEIAVMEEEGDMWND